MYLDHKINLHKAVIYHLRACVIPAPEERQFPAVIRAVQAATAGDYGKVITVHQPVYRKLQPTAQEIVVGYGLDFLVTAAQYEEPYGVNYGKERPAQVPA